MAAGSHEKKNTNALFVFLDILIQIPGEMNGHFTPHIWQNLLVLPLYCQRANHLSAAESLWCH